MKQQLCQKLIAIAATGVASAIAQAPALAHQVQTNYILNDSTNRFTAPQASEQSSNQAASRTGTSIELQTGFSNGEPLKGADVVVYAPNNPTRIWAKGVTDSEGKFNFAPDTAIKGDWEVQITREGHADVLTVPVSDRGIEADLVSQGERRDIHYAQASPLAIVASIAVAAACVVFAYKSEKQKA